MEHHDDNLKPQKEKVQRALEDLTEATSNHSPESEEVQQAKEKRAHAEKELVDSRGSAGAEQSQ